MSASSLPQCVQSGATALAAQVGCGQDLACGCHSSAFLAGVQPLIYQLCPDPSSALSQAQEFCVAADPHLLDTRRNTIIIPISIFLGLAIIALVLRLYARHVSKARIGTDDWLAVAAFVFAVVSNILELYGLANGEATHQFMVRLDLMESSNKTTIATSWTITSAILMLKLSILALYLRLFGHIKKFAYTVYAVAILVIVVSLVAVIFFTCQCRPVAYFWDRTIPGGECWNFQYVIVAMAVLDFVTGLIILSLPVPILWRLHMSAVKKVAIGGLFVIGSFTCIAGVLRIPFILIIDPYDIFWTLVPFTTFSALEVNLGLISICLPALQPLFGRVLARTGLSGHTGSSTKRHSRKPGNDIQIYSGSGRAHNSNSVWTAPKGSRPTDSQRILSRKSDDENWPMNPISVMKEIDVHTDKDPKHASLEHSEIV